MHGDSSIINSRLTFAISSLSLAAMGRIKTDSLFQIWSAKEQRENRRITLREVVAATGLSAETIAKIRDGETTLFDESVLAALCEFFDVPSGAPVPFLVFEADKNETKPRR